MRGCGCLLLFFGVVSAVAAVMAPSGRLDSHNLVVGAMLVVGGLLLRSLANRRDSRHDEMVQDQLRRRQAAIPPDRRCHGTGVEWVTEGGPTVPQTVMVSCRRCGGTGWRRRWL